MEEKKIKLTETEKKAIEEAIKSRKRGAEVKKKIELTEGAIKAIEEALSLNRGVEVKLINSRIIVWETSSKKQYETAITVR